MKKILALLIAAVTLMSFAACDGDKDSTSGGATETTASDTTATETTEPPVTTPAETEPPEDKVYTLTFVGDCTLGTAPSKMSYSKCFINFIISSNIIYIFTIVQYS